MYEHSSKNTPKGVKWGMNNEKPRVIDEEFLMSFTKRYTDLKDQGFIPVVIREELKKILDCKDTSYYKYLNLARKKGYITDSFEENMAKRRERERKVCTNNQDCSCCIDAHEVTDRNTTICDDNELIRIIDPLNLEPTTEEIPASMDIQQTVKKSWFSNLFGKFFKK